MIQRLCPRCAEPVHVGELLVTHATTGYAVCADLAMLDAHIHAHADMAGWVTLNHLLRHNTAAHLDTHVRPTQRRTPTRPA